MGAELGLHGLKYFKGHLTANLYLQLVVLEVEKHWPHRQARVAKKPAQLAKILQCFILPKNMAILEQIHTTVSAILFPLAVQLYDDD